MDRGYKKCKRCGAEYLHWVNVSGKWRLSVDRHGRNLHVCPPKSKPEEDDHSPTYRQPGSGQYRKEKVDRGPVLKVGDRVEVSEKFTGIATTTMTGTIVQVSDNDHWTDLYYGIELDEELENAHDCLGLCRKNRGWLAHKSTVKIYYF